MQVSHRTLEREVKFRIGRKFSLPRFPGGRLQTERFVSTYYDTDDYRLLRHGLTLRYRATGRAGAWQLKIPVDEGRLEVEFRGGSRTPPEAVLKALWAPVAGERLRAIARMRTRRTGGRVRVGGGTVALSVDAVDVLEDGRPSRHFQEAEAELVAGDAKALRRVTKLLKKAGAAKSDQRPKVLQALGLSSPSRNASARRSLPAIEHLKALLTRELTSLLVHDVGLRVRSDPEDVHQLRVTTRRLRSVLRAARGRMLGVDWVEHLRDELAALGTALGAVRDLDVLLGHLREQRAGLAASERPALHRILDALEHERRARRRALLEMLAGDRYRTLLEHLEAAARSPMTTDANARLDEIAGRQFDELRRSVRKIGKTPDDAELHRVRIKSKRARYAAELAEASRGKPATRFIEQVKALQDILGEHHDAVVAEQLLRTALPPSAGDRTALLVGRLIERQRERRSEMRAAFAKAWRKTKRRGRSAWG